MSLPSTVLDAIVRTLQAELQPANDPSIDTPLIDVTTSDDIADDIAGKETIGDPAVVLTCRGLGGMGDLYSPSVVNADFVARCYARVAEGPEDVSGSKGDVAMDLATLVGMIVERSIWQSAPPNPTALVNKRASGVRIQNRTSNDTLKQGRALWLVTWSQQMELTGRDQVAAFRAFKRLHVTIAMGDADVADAEALIEMPGGSP